MRALISFLFFSLLPAIAMADVDSLRSEASILSAAGEFAVATDKLSELVVLSPDDGAARFPCASDERHHAFDFWIGEWDVTANGQFAGTNSIQPILGHCALFEQWESATSGLGKSFNYYDPAYDHWRQIWISDSGSIIEFTGKARDGGIFYTAETIDPADRSKTLHKFEFTEIDGGIVRQYWETSTDDGETWQPIWDGRYKRKSKVAAN